MKAKIRKIVTLVEETRREMDKTIEPATRRAAAAAVIENPFAGRYVEDLSELMEIGEALRRSKRSLACGGTNDLERGAQLSKRVGRAADDLLQRARALIGFCALYMDGRRGLRVDGDQAVRDRVMQLVR